MPPANLVQLREQLRRGERLPVDADRSSRLKGDLDVLGRVGSILRVHGEDVHVLLGLVGRVLQDVALRRDKIKRM